MSLGLQRTAGPRGEALRRGEEAGPCERMSSIACVVGSLGCGMGGGGGRGYWGVQSGFVRSPTKWGPRRRVIPLTSQCSGRIG